MSPVTKASLLVGIGLARTASAGGELPPYPGAHRLCQQHVAGATMHIEWTSWATADAPDKVTTFYEHATGHTAATDASGVRTIAGRDANHSLSIAPVAQAGALPSCDTKPAAHDRTVIVISQAIR